MAYQHTGQTTRHKVGVGRSCVGATNEGISRCVSRRYMPVVIPSNPRRDDATALYPPDGAKALFSRQVARIAWRLGLASAGQR